MKQPDPLVITLTPELDISHVAAAARRVAAAYWNMAEELDPLEHHAFQDGSGGELECGECGAGVSAPQHWTTLRLIEDRPGKPDLVISHPGLDVFLAVTIEPGSQLRDDDVLRSTCYVYPGEPEYEPVLELMRARTARLEDEPVGETP